MGKRENFTYKISILSVVYKSNIQSEFNFFQHWYPLIPTEDLEPQKPKSMTLLGKRLVIWKPTQSETYRVFLDQCPHRLAPLSEGRIEDKTGNLMCSYHGWEFNENGICQRVPQAENPEIIAKNQDNFCVISFPVRQQQEILWVWPDEKTAAIAENTPLQKKGTGNREQGTGNREQIRNKSC
jgi:phenylpropionate dioxygenase-like ring-hydroxylating dioxygenase large terminal subunit